MRKTSINRSFLCEVARRYAFLQHSPDSPNVRNGYRAFAGEITEQYRRLTGYYGITVEPVADDPYQTSAALIHDVETHKRLRVYGFAELPEGHPGLWDLGPEADNLPLNVAFRAVHDFYGHVQPRNSFSMAGEYRAFLKHAEQFKRPDSVRVVATETLGQNAWFNHGPYAFLPATQRPFAEQKAAFLPSDIIRRALLGEGLK